MIVFGIHSSVDKNCGIYIFNKYVSKTLTKKNIQFKTLHISECFNLLPNNNIVILHYVPSAFSDIRRSNLLIKFLRLIKFKKLIVIFHGVYRKNEDRYDKDTICPLQSEHIKLISKKAEFLISLSESIKVNLTSWLDNLTITNKIIKLEHPGLFIQEPSINIDKPYIFFGGISRRKKNDKNQSTKDLIRLCNLKKILIWMHWTNLNNINFSKRKIVWRMSSGLLSDQDWCNIISNSGVVVCPYETKIQSMSGLIAEALSAHRYVLTTAFDFAIEMQARYPSLVFVNNHIEQWPTILEDLLNKIQSNSFKHYNWINFGDDLMKLFLNSHRDF